MFYVNRPLRERYCELEETIHKLRIVSGRPIDELLKLFAAGYTLTPPEPSGSMAELSELAEESGKKLDRVTALAVLKDLSKDMYPSQDIFGTKTLCITRRGFEQVRKKYLDDLR